MLVFGLYSDWRGSGGAASRCCSARAILSGVDLFRRVEPPGGQVIDVILIDSRGRHWFVRVKRGQDGDAIEGVSSWPHATRRSGRWEVGSSTSKVRVFFPIIQIMFHPHVPSALRRIRRPTRLEFLRLQTSFQ